MNVPVVSRILEGAQHQYDFVVVTEMWDYQNYDPQEHGADRNPVPSGCPSTAYVTPSIWTSQPNDWMPNPGYLQRYRDAFICGNANTKVFYYQSWTLGYNEVINGATRPSSTNFRRPSIAEIAVDIAGGNITPDLPLADRIEYEGVKWERFVAAANRTDIVMIPAAYGLAAFMRDIESGQAPGFEALSTTGGLDDTGTLAWTNYLFYQDQYHLSSVGQYLMGLIIYAGVFNRSPVGAPIGTDLYPNSQFFATNQFPLQEVTDAEYQALLNTTGPSGVYDLRGHLGKDYIPTRLRVYLQELAWSTIVNNQ